MKTAILVVLCLIPFIFANDSCYYRVSGTEEYDLSSLENTNNDYTVSYDPQNANKRIYLNMCRPVINLLCGSGVAGCQDYPGSQSSLGRFDSLAFSTGLQVSGDEGLILTYTGGDSVVAINKTVQRSMVIEFKCDESGANDLSFYEEDTRNYVYYLTWRTVAGCSLQDQGKKLSGGAIAGIVIACVVFVLLVIGAIIFFIRRNGGGSESGTTNNVEMKNTGRSTVEIAREKPLSEED